MSLNGISTLASKQLKQEGKLAIAETKRQATTVTTSGTGKIIAVTTSAVVNANVSFATAFLTQATVGALLQTTGAVTIGTISSIQSDTQLTLTANAASNQSTIAYNFNAVNNGYRTLNTANIDILPTKYFGNAIVDNIIDGNVLITGRPWQ